MTKRQLPRYKDLLWPTLKALEARGGSASIQELSEQVAADLELSGEILAVPHKDGPQSEVDYRSAWARTALKRVDAVANTSRGVWTITETGRRMRTEDEMHELIRRDRAKLHKRRPSRNAESNLESDAAPDAQDWQEALLDIVRGMAHDAFERLWRRVFLESGFTKVEVTGRSGDSGIAGAGVLRANNLISFHILFQCKRYAGSVDAPAIRDFRGAMAGRADKGLLITTGEFTRDAEREAVRDGYPAIDLIGGLDLCILLKDLGLGVSTETVEVVKPRPEFFANL